MNTGAKVMAGVACLVAVAGVGLAGHRYARHAVEGVVHDYILDHPEILPQAMENLQRKQDQAQLAGIRGAVETPFPGAVLGNPNGKVTLVEFSDFACGYCRHSVADVQQLIAGNPDLRVVIRELPVINPVLSPAAAKMGLAAARQGKYAQFHAAMFAAGQLDEPTIEAVAKGVGLDMDRARRDVADPALQAELQNNINFASQLGFSGTPSWVAGDRLMSGAVGIDALRNAVAGTTGA